MPDDTLTFDHILHDEIDAINERRSTAGTTRDAHANAYERAAKSDLVGLSFSGGGIRSATFNLGVLQALQELNILDKIDYLSTVSGGGYIGSWFVSWVKRLGAIPALTGKTNDKGEYKEPNPIRHLRRYSNYLTPKVGLMNADTWSIASTYLRNLLLNLLVLVPLFVAVLLIPHLLLSLVPLAGSISTTTLFFIAYTLLIVSCVGVGLNLVWKKPEIGGSEGGKPADTTSSGRRNVKAPKSFGIALASTLVAAGIGAYVLNRVAKDPNLQFPFTGDAGIMSWVLYGFALFVLLWVLAFLPFMVARLIRKQSNQGEAEKQETTKQSDKAAAQGGGIQSTVRKMSSSFRGWGAVVLGGILAGPVCGLFFYALFQKIIPALNTPYLDIVFGMPAVLATLASVVMLQIGIAGSGLPDFAREWWSRFGGWATICCVVWMAATGVTFYSYDLVNSIPDWLSGMNITLAWAVTTAYGLVAARSDRTGSAKSNKALEMFIKMTPVLFIVGLVTLISYSVHGLLSKNDYFVFAGVIAACLAISSFFAWRVNVNVFSMNSMYYNRLTRCYLGASRDRTNVNPIIGFDAQDDEFGTYQFVDGEPPYVGPYPIINTAVNLVKGKELSWQKRKASSFVFTPLYCGFRSGIKDCYGRSGEYPTRLGRAVSISGAAASPNMGYHTSVPLSFLMTIFNVRLGSWFPNPAVLKKEEEDERVNTDGPAFGLFYLLKELFGLTDETSRYVYLSDGGHFENLGLYELVRRRCRYIIVCDAAADPQMAFGDLGSAIEKCRSDFGVEIDLDVEPLRRDPATGVSKAHWVRGKIRYAADENLIDGVKADERFTGEILYIKSSLTGDEPTDVLSYRELHKEFPHESTADQWFDESQFESYRKLGYHIVRGLSASSFKSVEALMRALSQPARRRGVPENAKRGLGARASVLPS